MISSKQLIANQQNAKKSTGPKSYWGKQKVRSNALSHGLYAENLLIIGEKAKEFEDFKSSMIKSLEPQDAIQDETSSQIIATGWNIRRLNSMETGIMMKMQMEANEFSSKSFQRKFSSKSFDGLVNEVPEHIEIMGHAFKRDCMDDNSIIKLSTIRQRLYNQYYRLLDIYRDMKGDGNEKS
jgi:hypothetical protein